MWKTGDPEMATPKRVRTSRPKHSDTTLSREWRINMANRKKKKITVGKFQLISLFLYLGIMITGVQKRKDQDREDA